MIYNIGGVIRVQGILIHVNRKMERVTKTHPVLVGMIDYLRTDL